MVWKAVQDRLRLKSSGFRLLREAEKLLVSVLSKENLTALNHLSCHSKIEIIIMGALEGCCEN